MLYSALIATTLTPWKKKEAFDDGSNDGKWVWIVLLVLLVVLVIELALAVWAVYLSWTSNSLVGWNVGAKLFFAFVAFFFALNYLLIHLFNKWDLTNHIRDQNARIHALEYPPAFTGGATRKSKKT